MSPRSYERRPKGWPEPTDQAGLRQSASVGLGLTALRRRRLLEVAVDVAGRRDPRLLETEPELGLRLLGTETLTLRGKSELLLLVGQLLLLTAVACLFGLLAEGGELLVAEDVRLLPAVLG